MRLAWIVALALMLPVAAAAQTLERVRDSGVLKIGYRDDAAPYSYTNAIGQPAGYTIALFQAVATDIAAEVGRAELAIEYVLVDTGNRFSAIQEGRIDLLCSADTATLGRRKLIDFSVPAATLANLDVCRRRGRAMVIGTTGIDRDGIARRTGPVEGDQPLLAEQRVDERRLAAAGRAEQDGQLTLGQRQIDAAQRMDGTMAAAVDLRESERLEAQRAAIRRRHAIGGGRQ